MIRQQARSGSRILIALVVLAVITVSFVMMQIRFGGPIQRKHSLNDEMLADILPPPAFVVEPYLESSLAAANPARGQKSLERIAEIRAEFEARKTYWDEAPVPDELRPQLKATIAVADQFFGAVDSQLKPAISSGDRERINGALEAYLTPLYHQQHSEVTKLVGMIRDINTRDDARDSWIVSICLAFSALLAVVAIGAIQRASVLIRRRIVEPLDDASRTIDDLASGNYEVVIDGTDRVDEFGSMARAMEIFRTAGIAREQARREQERVVEVLTVGLDKLAAKDLEYRIAEELPENYDTLRQNYNSAVQTLAEAMGAVRVGASSVMNAISEIRAASDDLALRNQQQAASLEETSAAMRQVTNRVQDSAANVATAQGAISHARQQATEGGDVVQEAIGAMAAIEGSAQEIASIVDVIDGIAFQTNLLALNAGVEAARAGDAGKGFAVVATEVRALAQRSADAAQNIKELIARSSSQVESGVSLVGQTGDKLGQIVGHIVELHDLITAMANSAREQAADLQQVGGAVNDMDNMTQQNAAMVEETTAATRSLEAEARALTQMMATFRTRLLESRLDAGDSGLRRTSGVDEVSALQRQDLQHAA